MVWIVSIVLLTVLTVFYPGWRRKTAIKRWYTTLALDKHLTVYQHLFKDINGFSLSRQARVERDALEYTYGEIDFISFIALLSLAQPDSNTIFYDLGSGIGKAVLASAMVFNVQKSCGIELFSVLHHTALKQQLRLKELPDYQQTTNCIAFINTDFLQADFYDATLVFINATAFFGETWKTLNHQLNQLKPGTIVITTTKKLPSDAFFLKKISKVQMSWGPVKAYIHQRLPCSYPVQINKNSFTVT